MNIRDTLNQAAARLKEAGVASARLDAEVLLACFLHIDRLELYKAPEKTLGPEEREGFEKWLERRLQGEPVAYIRGEKEFWSLTFEVNRDVLIPRPETEVLVEETLQVAAELGRGDLQILEIGVGSGAVSAALAKELPEARLVATDASAAALVVAGRNACRLGLDARIEFRRGKFFEPLTETFDIIVSNPPYIPGDEYAGLARGVKAYEPREALLAGDTGTECHREIIARGSRHLKEGGWLLMEMGAGQRELIEQLLTATGDYDCLDTRCDYGGLERVIKARKRQVG